MKILNKHSVEINFLEEWRVLAPPAKDLHWKVEKSAYELANVWVNDGQVKVPKEIEDVMY